MDKKTAILNEIREKGLLPLYYNDGMEESTAILHALYDAGIRAVEYTNRGKLALDNFRSLKKSASGKLAGMYLGIGTIKTAQQARDFLDAGADFIISPGIPPDVADFVHLNNTFWIPGCLTPTEMIAAESLGIDFIKIFPGNLLGPSYVQSVRDLFPAMQFMPTGGVEPNRDNIHSWFNAGVSAVGMGSQLISKAAVQNKNYDGIRDNTRKALEYIQEWKKAKGK